jgi:purine-binding chemotaxis protein CheW
MSTDDEAGKAAGGGEGERYLSFSLGPEEYAIPLLGVKEVVAVPEITPIPFTPPHFLGIMNLRGQVISVIDLRQRLGIKAGGNSETAVIICDLSPLVLGVVVDSINAVVAKSAAEISAKPDVQSTRSSDYITGVFHKDKKLVLLLEIGHALGVEDLRIATHQSARREAA